MERDQYLGMHSDRWPDPRRGPWVLRFHFASVNGRAECVGLDVRSFDFKEEESIAPRPPDAYKPVSIALLRSLRATQLAEARAVQRDLLAYTADLSKAGAKARRAAAQQIPLFSPGELGGRPPKYGPEHFEKVANVYADALGRGRTPTRAVARHFDVSQTTAAKWVAKARELDLLGPTTKGKAGGIDPPAPRKGKKR